MWDVEITQRFSLSEGDHRQEPHVCQGTGSMSAHHDTTLVTALYDIGRAEEGDGRSMHQYIDWLVQHTIKLKSPFVVFCSDVTIKEAIFRSRSDADVPIIVCRAPITSIPYYYLKDEVESIQKSSLYVNKMKSPERVECKLPLYIPLQFSKFPWLSVVAEANPFGSSLFFWVDAGAGRWTTGVEGQEWPNMQKIQNMRNISSSQFIVAQMYSGYDKVDRRWGRNVQQFLWSDKHYIAGTTFGVDKQTTAWLEHQMHHILVHEFLKHHSVVNTEQHALFLLWLRHPTSFALVPGTCPPDVGCRSQYNKFLTIFDTLS